MRRLHAIADLWISRYARPDAAALAAVAGQEPVVVVTGGSEGIGLALARSFAGEGSDLVLIARREPELRAAADAITRDFGRRVWPLALDLVDIDAPEKIEHYLGEHGLYADVLVNNAGCGLAGPFDAASEADIGRLVALNVAALTRLTRRFLPGMRDRGRGGLLNVASLGGLAPGPNQAAYYASKAYVISLTEALAFEYRGRGVRIAVLAPGPVETAFHARMGAERANYRRLVTASAPTAVGASAVRWFGWGKRVIVPGIAANIMALGMRFVPHPAVIPIVGWLLALPGGRGHARRQHE